MPINELFSNYLVRLQASLILIIILNSAFFLVILESISQNSAQHILSGNVGHCARFRRVENKTLQTGLTQTIHNDFHLKPMVGNYEENTLPIFTNLLISCVSIGCKVGVERAEGGEDVRRGGGRGMDLNRRLNEWIYSLSFKLIWE